jgi:acyl carrier protein
VEAIEALMLELRQKIIATQGLVGMKPEDISNDGPLFGPETGLDSIDVLELVVMIEKEYGVAIQGREVGEAVFRSLRSLATYLAEKRAQG